MRLSAKTLIEEFLKQNGPAPVHGINIFGHSQTAISARLREMAREGIVTGYKENGKPYKTWRAVLA